MKNEIQITECSIFNKFEKFFGKTLFHGNDWEGSQNNPMIEALKFNEVNVQSVCFPTSKPEQRFYGFDKICNYSKFIKLIIYIKYTLLPSKYQEVGVHWTTNSYDYETESDIRFHNFAYYICPALKAESQNFRDFSVLDIEVSYYHNNITFKNKVNNTEDIFTFDEIDEFLKACKNTVLLNTFISVSQGNDGWAYNQNFFIETEDCKFIESINQNKFMGFKIKQKFNIEEDNEFQEVIMEVTGTTTFDDFIEEWWKGIDFNHKVKFSNCSKASLKNFMEAVGRVAWT